jgi:hypothetical protein
MVAGTAVKRDPHMPPNEEAHPRGQAARVRR